MTERECPVCGVGFVNLVLHVRRGHGLDLHALETVVIPPSKDDAACCRAHALSDGRPVIGFCSPTCIRRPVTV